MLKGTGQVTHSITHQVVMGKYFSVDDERVVKFITGKEEEAKLILFVPNNPNELDKGLFILEGKVVGELEREGVRLFLQGEVIRRIIELMKNEIDKEMNSH